VFAATCARGGLLHNPEIAAAWRPCGIRTDTRQVTGRILRVQSMKPRGALPSRHWFSSARFILLESNGFKFAWLAVPRVVDLHNASDSMPSLIGTVVA
jgi:hypothetical protein